MRARYDGSMVGWRLEHTYTQLPQLFFADAVPTPVSGPRIVAFNRPLATMLGLQAAALEGPDGAAIFVRLPRRMRATSSVTSRLSVMAARFSSASRSHQPASASTFN
jgi:uncharacterized protein YdiU (UPF0061 family)